MSPAVLTEVDVCAGIGGVSLAAELAGFTPICFVENDPFCQHVLTKHWPEVPILGDIRTLTVDSFRAVGVGRIDLMHISPPCQFASIAGKQQGTADPRYLWPDAFRLVAGLRPRVVLVENVDSVVRLVLDDWLTDLESIGYQARAIVLPACAVGAPHLRYRLFVVAHTISVQCERGREFGELAGAERVREIQAKEWERLRDSAGDSGAPVEHSNGAGCQELDTAAIAGRESLSAWGRDARALGNAEDRGDRTGLCPNDSGRLGRGRSDDTDSQDGGPERSQPGVGRSADGVSDWMEQRGLIWPALHGAWPALMGLPPEDWEPPRTLPKQGRNGRKRLKALGNSVVPAQVAPILFVIANWLREHAATDEEEARGQDGQAPSSGG